ncbi:hypothetical protein [Mesorhizobium sp. GbtcB19]|uniref:hypothetical protein n=1 Tax=Mesorhizobium sp. GbtcB19 TaxID=2824764 RepID=UPI001C30E9BD|nr:hypothetical protein [Mesorhizobium sp. GbtcB19]
MPVTKRQADALGPQGPEDASPAKRRAVELAGFDDLPYEMQQEVFRNVLREVANRPNRLEALADLEGVLENNARLNHLVDKTNDLSESKAALQRHPSVASRYVALCSDVVSGTPFKDALRQNGPLPEDDKVMSQDVTKVLEDATPTHLANLADVFSAQRGAAAREALIGVAGQVGRQHEVRSPELASADLGNLTTLTGAFVKNKLSHEDRDVRMAVRALAEQVAERDDNLLSHANIHQIVTLSDTFSGHGDCEEALEALAKQVAERGEDLLPSANIEQIVKLTFAFARDGEPFEDTMHFESAMDKLASHVTRGDELLSQASKEQLADLRDIFAGTEVQFNTLAGLPFEWPDEPDHPEALAKVVEEMKNRDEAERLGADPQRRSQLDNRDRSRERSVER